MSRETEALSFLCYVSRQRLLATVFLVTLSIGAAAADPSATRPQALIVANYAYSDGSRTSAPTSDLNALAKALEKVGYSVESRINLSAPDLQELLRTSVEGASHGKRLFVYLAGKFQRNAEQGLSLMPIASVGRSVPISDLLSVLPTRNQFGFVWLDGVVDTGDAQPNGPGRQPPTRLLEKLSNGAFGERILLVDHVQQGDDNARRWLNNPGELVRILSQELDQFAPSARLFVGRVKERLHVARGRQGELHMHSTLTNQPIVFQFSEVKLMPSASDVAVSSPVLTDARRHFEALGLIAEPTTDIWSFEMRRAIRAFQLRTGLPATGELNTNTLQALSAVSTFLKDIPPAQLQLTASESTSLATEAVMNHCVEGLVSEHEPELVLLTGGCFSLETKTRHGRSSTDAIETCVKPFAIGKYETTQAEFEHFARETAIKLQSQFVPDKSRRPIVFVNFQQAQAYTQWLREKSGRSYRLPTEIEWEFAARAGETGDHPWGTETLPGQANCVACGSLWDGTDTAPVGSFEPNSFGLHDVVGNVWEWTCSLFDVAISQRGAQCREAPDRIAFRVARGGAFKTALPDATLWARVRLRERIASNILGFRVARELTQAERSCFERR